MCYLTSTPSKVLQTLVHLSIRLKLYLETLIFRRRSSLPRPIAGSAYRSSPFGTIWLIPTLCSGCSAVCRMSHLRQQTVPTCIEQAFHGLSLFQILKYKKDSFFFKKLSSMFIWRLGLAVKIFRKQSAEKSCFFLAPCRLRLSGDTAPIDLGLIEAGFLNILQVMAVSVKG